jgi:ketosteroid isomerase-like protein
MSQENVELVRQLQPGPDGDLVSIIRDDAIRAAWLQAVTPVFHADVASVIHVIGAEAVTHVGLDGLQAAWLEWLAPWASYRSDLDQLVDAGDRVVALVRDFGRRAPDGPEVEMIAAAVWTVREGKVARVEFYTDRAAALEAAG